NRIVGSGITTASAANNDTGLVHVRGGAGIHVDDNRCDGAGSGIGATCINIDTAQAQLTASTFDRNYADFNSTSALGAIVVSSASVNYAFGVSISDNVCFTGGNPCIHVSVAGITTLMRVDNNTATGEYASASFGFQIYGLAPGS